MVLHGRRARLLLEYEKLINLEKRSDFIKVEPVNKIEGMPPEEYIVTFTCRGIAGLKPDKSPELADFHQVSMKLSSNFPNQEPYLKWLTPIWHPNIEHKEPHHVCTNNVQNWYSTKSLNDLVVSLGEMVQYRRYHAEWVAPFPLDKEAADWVINFAEPSGLLGQTKPIDERQILRPLRTVRRPLQNPVNEMPRPSGKLKLGVKKTAHSDNGSNPLISIERQTTQETEPQTTKETERQTTQESRNSVENLSTAAVFGSAGISQSNPTTEPVRRRGITLGLRTKEVLCICCYENFTVPNVATENDSLFVCDKCRDYVRLSE